MAAPATATNKNLSGVYVLNRTVSDSMQPLLKMQGVGFLVRQAVQYSNIETTIVMSTNDEGATVIDSHAVSTGGVKNDETWIVDGVGRDKTNWIWGKVEGTVKYMKISEIEDEYLKEGWSQDCIDDGVIVSWSRSISDTWVAQQVMGFAEIDGERRHVRRVLGTKGDEVHRVRMIYDWKPEE